MMLQRPQISSSISQIARQASSEILSIWLHLLLVVGLHGKAIAVSPTNLSALSVFHHLRLPHHDNHVRNLEPWHRHWYNVHSPEPTILVKLPSLRSSVQVADKLFRVCEIKTPLQESARDATALIIGVDCNAAEICKV